MERPEAISGAADEVGLVAFDEVQVARVEADAQAVGAGGVDDGHEFVDGPGRAGAVFEADAEFGALGVIEERSEGFGASGVDFFDRGLAFAQGGASGVQNGGAHADGGEKVDPSAQFVDDRRAVVAHDVGSEPEMALGQRDAEVVGIATERSAFALGVSAFEQYPSVFAAKLQRAPTAVGEPTDGLLGVSLDQESGPYGVLHGVAFLRGVAAAVVRTVCIIHEQAAGSSLRRLFRVPYFGLLCRRFSIVRRYANARLCGFRGKRGLRMSFARSVVRPVLTIALLAALCLLGSACSEIVKPYAMDPGVSVNVGLPRTDWPTVEEEATMTPAKTEVLKKMGRPDMMYLNWYPRELITNQSGVYMRTRNHNLDKLEVPTDWVYLDAGKFVRFKGDRRYEVEDLPDKLRVVCEFGDPNDISTYRGSGGTRMETWKYYRDGVIVKFADDRKFDVDRTTIPPMSNYPRN